MDEAVDLRVAEDEAGQRLDRFLVARLGNLGRARAKRWLSDGRVLVDGHRLRKGDRLRAGQRVQLLPDPGCDPGGAQALASGREVRVVYEDAALLVVDKPAGMPTHGMGSPDTDRHTLTAWLVARYPELAAVGYRTREPGIVHRLDNDTSGLLLVARDARTFTALVRALRAGEIDKRYQALCTGTVTAPQVLEGYLVSDRRARVKVSGQQVPRSRFARTEVLEARPVLMPSGVMTLVTLRAAHAGRHQIRAQLAAVGHPLVGDILYGGPQAPGLKRHFLHASELRLRHPVSGENLHVRSDLPPELRALIDSV